MFTLNNFYKSREWETFRQVIINDNTDSNGYVHCAMCGKPILKKYDLIIHHKIELTDDNVNDYNISLNPDNVMCVHFTCHNKIHERFGYGTGGRVYKPKQVYIVYGAPCAGKSTWVNEVATEKDLIVDMDSIYQCISNNDRYIKPDALRGVAFEIRDSLYNIIKYRSGRWQNAYIITGGARVGDRERLGARVGADDFIFIDTGRDECLERARGRGKEWSDYINEWFDSYQCE